MGTRLTIYWDTADRSVIERIRKRFGIPLYTTVNGESPAEVEDRDMEHLRQAEKLGYIRIRDKKWCKKGGQYIFISRLK